MWVMIVRYIISLMGWLILLRMSQFLWVYHHKIYKLRKELEGHVLAPPVLWTYLYHVGVSFVILGNAVGTLIAANRGNPFNPALLLILFGMVILYPTVDRFARYYIRDLEQGVRDRLN